MADAPVEVQADGNPEQSTDDSALAIGPGGSVPQPQLSFADQWARAGLDEVLANPSNLRPSCEEMSKYS